jgi:hypothetical protein
MSVDAPITPDALTLLRLMDTPSGRTGWLLSKAETYNRLADELVGAGLAVRKRLGGYPGLLVTELGRVRIAREKLNAR